MKIKVYYKKISCGYIELDSRQEDIDKAIDETMNKVKNHNFNIFDSYEHDCSYEIDIIKTIKENKKCKNIK